MSNQPTVGLIESLFGQSTEYAKNRFQLLKLKAIDKSASVASYIVIVIALLIVFLIFFIIFNIGLALLIGALVGRTWAGFLILSAIYGIVCFILVSKREKLFKAPVTGMLIRKFL